METKSRRPTATSNDCPEPADHASLGEADDRRAAARIPDSIAVLSYGTQVLALPRGGPRIF